MRLLDTSFSLEAKILGDALARSITYALFLLAVSYPLPDLKYKYMYMLLVALLWRTSIKLLINNTFLPSGNITHICITIDITYLIIYMVTLNISSEFNIFVSCTRVYWYLVNLNKFQG